MSDISLGAKIGIAIASIAVAIIVFLIIAFVIRHKKQNNTQRINVNTQDVFRPYQWQSSKTTNIHQRDDERSQGERMHKGRKHRTARYHTKQYHVSKPDHYQHQSDQLLNESYSRTKRSFKQINFPSSFDKFNDESVELAGDIIDNTNLIKPIHFLANLYAKNKKKPLLFGVVFSADHYTQIAILRGNQKDPKRKDYELSDMRSILAQTRKSDGFPSRPFEVFNPIKCFGWKSKQALAHDFDKQFNKKNNTDKKYHLKKFYVHKTLQKDFEGKIQKLTHQIYQNSGKFDVNMHSRALAGCVQSFYNCIEMGRCCKHLNLLGDLCVQDHVQNNNVQPDYAFSAKKFFEQSEHSDNDIEFHNNDGNIFIQSLHKMNSIIPDVDNDRFKRIRIQIIQYITNSCTLLTEFITAYNEKIEEQNQYQSYMKEVIEQKKQNQYEDDEVDNSEQKTRFKFGHSDFHSSPQVGQSKYLLGTERGQNSFGASHQYEDDEVDNSEQKTRFKFGHSDFYSSPQVGQSKYLLGTERGQNSFGASHQYEDDGVDNSEQKTRFKFGHSDFYSSPQVGQSNSEQKIRFQPTFKFGHSDFHSSPQVGQSKYLLGTERGQNSFGASHQYEDDEVDNSEQKTRFQTSTQFAHNTSKREEEFSDVEDALSNSEEEVNDNDIGSNSEEEVNDNDIGSNSEEEVNDNDIGSVRSRITKKALSSTDDKQGSVQTTTSFSSIAPTTNAGKNK